MTTDGLTDQKWLVLRTSNPRWDKDLRMAISMDMFRDAAVPVLAIGVQELSKHIGWDDVRTTTWEMIPGYWKATGGVHEITVEEADEQGFWS